MLDLDVLEKNLSGMAERAKSLDVSLRPHVKTHKCVEVAERQRAIGATGITVSTLYEAKTFADHGFEDIVWAFPVILGRIPEAVALSERVTFTLVIDSLEAVDALEQTRRPLRVRLKVDSGYHRAGVAPRSEAALELARRLDASTTLAFDGILTHSGHAYHASPSSEVARIAEEERGIMATFAERLRSNGIEVPTVSVGSTPAMSTVGDLTGVDEARPGSYALYDYMQTVLGSCATTDCAATVIASVVSNHPDTNHCVVDAGALALSKDAGTELAPRATMGEIFESYGAGSLRRDARVVSVSQEHGTVSAPLAVGTRVRILPNHSCLTVAQFDEYYVARGDEIVDRWKVWRGRD